MSSWSLHGRRAQSRSSQAARGRTGMPRSAGLWLCSELAHVPCPRFPMLHSYSPLCLYGRVGASVPVSLSSWNLERTSFREDRPPSRGAKGVEAHRQQGRSGPGVHTGQSFAVCPRRRPRRA